MMLPCRPRARDASRAGALAVELMLAITVMVIGVGATLGSISSFARLEESNRESMQATLAARRVLERLQNETFRQVFALYNDDPADDPPGAPGAGFAVAGLDSQEGDADGLAGRVVFPVDPNTPGILFENFVSPDDGFPRDLDGDGAIDVVDHSTDYEILPVRVRIEWRGASGNRALELQTVLVDR